MLGYWNFNKLKVINRRAYYDYEILDKFEAGIVLTGPEVKSVKEGKIKLEGSFVRIINGEAFLINAHIHPYQFADNRNYQPTRTRKLLLHKKEIQSLSTKTAPSGLTLVPLSCYTKGHLIKLEVGIGKGKKKWDKREAIKKRDLKREEEIEARNKQ